MSELRVDVAILGGGLVGPALALALEQAGFRTAVIDAKAPEAQVSEDFDGRAYAIALASAKALGVLGVWNRVSAEAEPIRDIQVGEGAGSPALLHFDPRSLDEGRIGWILEDRFLRRALLSAMAEADLVHLAPAEVSEISDTPGAVEMGLADGRSLRAEVLVGADGRRSHVAREAGIGTQRWRYDQTGLVAALGHELPHNGLAHQSFSPGGPFAVLPLPGQRSSIVWSERTGEAERLQALPRAEFTAEIARRIGPRLGAIEIPGKVWAYPLDLVLADRYVAPRRALVGDAAHGVHPIAGQGLNLGLRDVAALAEVLTDASRLGEDIGAVNVLERYEQWRRFDNTAMALGMDGLNRLFSNALPGLGPLRQFGLRAVDNLPALARRFMREAAGLSGDAPRLLQGRAL